MWWFKKKKAEAEIERFEIDLDKIQTVQEVVTIAKLTRHPPLKIVLTKELAEKHNLTHLIKTK